MHKYKVGDEVIYLGMLDEYGEIDEEDPYYEHVGKVCVVRELDPEDTNLPVKITFPDEDWAWMHPHEIKPAVYPAGYQYEFNFEEAA